MRPDLPFLPQTYLGELSALARRTGSMRPAGTASTSATDAEVEATLKDIAERHGFDLELVRDDALRMRRTQVREALRLLTARNRRG